MVRPVRQEDLGGLLELLRWMDADPARRVLAPEARSEEELLWATDEGWVLEQDGHVAGYAALYPFRQGGALEGPLVQRADPAPLLERADEEARLRGWHTLYAFPHEANAALRTALETAGYAPLHTSYFFTTPPRDLAYPLPAGVRIERVVDLDPEVYCDLYRASEDAWSLRLGWTALELIEHFQRPDVHLWYAFKGNHPVGLVELETTPEAAEIAYLGVVPAARGRGVGRALLGAAAAHAFAQGAPLLRVRAHDHEKAAIALYGRLGFTLADAVVTYAKERSP
ncbi:GNAT family N-acetyltransferase [Oceanithermus sp.]